MQKETNVSSDNKGLSKKKQSNLENFPDPLGAAQLKEERKFEVTPTSLEQNRTKPIHVPCFDSNRLVTTPKATINSMSSNQLDQYTPSNQSYYSPCMPNDSGFVSSSNSSLVDLNRTYLNSLNLNAQFQMLAALNSPFYLYSSYQPTSSSNNINSIPTSIVNIPLPVMSQSTPEFHRVSKPVFKPYE